MKDKLMGFVLGFSVAAIALFVIAPCLHLLLFWIYNGISGKHVPV